LEASEWRSSAEFQKLVTDEAYAVMPEALAKVIREMPRDPEVLSRKSQFDIKCHPIDAGLLADFKRVQFQIPNGQPTFAFEQVSMNVVCLINLLV
jgi:hypothetical protein